MTTTTTKTKTNSVKISKRTLDILKNFATINAGILVLEGNEICTLSTTKTIMAEAKVDETFPKQFSIWDLNKFLATASLFKDPDFVFDDNYITIKSGKSSLRYFYCDSKLVSSTSKKITMPKSVVSFDLSAKDFAEIMKAASVLQVQNLCVRPTDDKKNLEIVAIDKNDVTSNVYSIQVGPYTTGFADFQFIFDVENLKILPGDYRVDISEKVVSRFSNKNEALEYWVALNADSTYEA